jgi:hypothetical protein
MLCIFIAIPQKVVLVLPVLRIHDILVRIRILLFSSVTFNTSTKKLFFSCFAFYFLKVHLHLIFQDKKFIEKSQNRRNQCFSYYSCLMIEESRSGAGSGSVSLTNGSGPGSWRPKNIWILQIRIRIV